MQTRVEPVQYFMLKMTVMQNGRNFDKAKTEETCNQIFRMLTQKAGYPPYIKKNDVSYENTERLTGEALCHAAALVLSGRLDGEQNAGPEI